MTNDQPDGVGTSERPAGALRRISRRAWSTMIVLGMAAALGTYVVNRLIDAGEDRLLDALKVTVTSHQTSSYLFPATAGPGEAPPGGSASDRFTAWAERSGAVPYGGIRVRLVLVGRDESPVTVTRVGIKVLAAEETRGSWVNRASDCGGLARRRLFRADLANDPPSVNFYRNGKVDARPAFRVSASDPELFDLEVQAGDQTYSMVIVADYSVEGRTGSTIVHAPDGEPFTLAGGGRPRVFREVLRGRQRVVLERQRSVRIRPENFMPC